jgi:hypothetical protein
MAVNEAWHARPARNGSQLYFCLSPLAFLSCNTPRSGRAATLGQIASKVSGDEMAIEPVLRRTNPMAISKSEDFPGLWA